MNRVTKRELIRKLGKYPNENEVIFIGPGATEYKILNFYGIKQSKFIFIEISEQEYKEPMYKLDE